MRFAEKFFTNPNYAEYWSNKIREQGYEESYRREFLRTLQARSGELFLEVGVGEGRNLLDLVPIGVGYVGIDISKEMLRKTRQTIPQSYSESYDLLLADATWLPFRSSSFDKVLSFATIFFVPNQAQAIGEIQSVAKIRIAIEFRNSRNPKVFLYGRMSAFTLFAQPLLRGLIRRNSVRKVLSLAIGETRARKLSNQIAVYGSLQPVFGINSTVLSKEMARNGWKIESMQTYSMNASGQSDNSRDQRMGRFKPVLVAHSVRERPVITLES